MKTRLTPYGSAVHAHIVAKTGGKGKTPPSLSARMPSPELASKVGTISVASLRQGRRVIRHNALN